MARGRNRSLCGYSSSAWAISPTIRAQVKIVAAEPPLRPITLQIAASAKSTFGAGRRSASAADQGRLDDRTGLGPVRERGQTVEEVLGPGVTIPVDAMAKAGNAAGEQPAFECRKCGLG